MNREIFTMPSAQDVPIDTADAREIEMQESVKGIRSLIREMLLREDEERLKKAAGAIYNRLEIYGDPHDDDIEFQSYASRRSDPYRLAGERELKRIWRENADHEFFDKGLLKIHAIGFMGTGGRSDKVFTDFLTKNHGKVNRDELSCVGVRPSDAKPGWFSHQFFRGGVFVKGRVTYAASGDLSTEWTQNATPEDLKRHAASGLPKRPLFFKNATAIGELVLDEEDWVKKVSSKMGAGKAPEMIVDNWRVESFVISSKMVKSLSPEKIETEFANVLKFCRDNGIPVVDETHTPIM